MEFNFNHIAGVAGAREVRHEVGMATLSCLAREEVVWNRPASAYKKRQRMSQRENTYNIALALLLCFFRKWDPLARWKKRQACISVSSRVTRLDDTSIFAPDSASRTATTEQSTRTYFSIFRLHQQLHNHGPNHGFTSGLFFAVGPYAAVWKGHSSRHRRALIDCFLCITRDAEQLATCLKSSSNRGL